VKLLGDGVVRITTRQRSARKDFGVDGNVAGMIPDATRLEGDAYSRARHGRAVHRSVPDSPLRILVYSSNALTRDQVRSALGRRVHPDLPS